MEATLQKQNSLLKKYLFENFGISVKILRDGGNFNIDYNLGCSVNLLDDIDKKLSSYEVDSDQDISLPKRNHKNLVVDGVEIQSGQFCRITRDISDKFNFEVAKTLSKFYKHSNLHECNTFEDYERNFSSMYGDSWNWRQLAHKELFKMNFVSQDENEIILINAFMDEDEHSWNNLHIIYSVNNQIYRTNDLPVKKEADNSPLEFSNEDFKIVEYSPKSIAVFGEKTKLIKEQLNQIGNYNRHLKGGPGWIFPKSKQSELMKILNINN